MKVSLFSDGCSESEGVAPSFCWCLTLRPLVMVLHSTLPSARNNPHTPSYSSTEYCNLIVVFQSGSAWMLFMFLHSSLIKLLYIQTS